MFRGIKGEELAELTAQFQTLELQKGEVLFHEGEPGDRLFIIVSGKVKLSRRSGDGRESILALLGPGEMFGEMTLFNPGPRSATATDVSNTELQVLNHADLVALLKRHPAVGTHLLAALAARLSRTDEALGDLVFSDVPGRVAKALVDLGKRFGQPGPDGVHLAHDLTQEELAQLVGASRETVNKALAEFSTRGWIKREGRSIVLRDIARLEHRGVS